MKELIKSFPASKHDGLAKIWYLKLPTRQGCLIALKSVCDTSYTAVGGRGMCLDF